MWWTMLRRTEQGARLEAADFGGPVDVICRKTNDGFGTGHNTVLKQLTSKSITQWSIRISLWIRMPSARFVSGWKSIRMWS